MSKKQFWMSTLLSSLTMAVFMSGLISGSKLGFSSEWPPIWFDSFIVAWPFALLLNLTVLPQVRKFAAWLTVPNPVENENG